IFWPMRRASTSDGPPAGNGTMMRMERAGKASASRSCCAVAPADRIANSARHRAAVAPVDRIAATTKTHRGKTFTTPAPLMCNAAKLTPVVAAFSIWRLSPATVAGCKTAAGHAGGHGLRCRDDQARPPMAVQALFFDVFGTLMDFRTSIAREA